MSNPVPREGVARRMKDGWVWYDRLGKDYGPWPTKRMAEQYGPEHAAREEKILRLPCSR